MVERINQGRGTGTAWEYRTYLKLLFQGRQLLHAVPFVFQNLFLKAFVFLPQMSDFPLQCRLFRFLGLNDTASDVCLAPLHLQLPIAEGFPVVFRLWRGRSGTLQARWRAINGRVNIRQGAWLCIIACIKKLTLGFRLFGFCAPR